MIDPISSAAPVSGAYAVGPSGDNERTERFPDNEAMEMKARTKAPLAPYQGNTIDVEA
jgi:hypothetical protein